MKMDYALIMSIVKKKMKMGPAKSVKMAMKELTA